MQTILFGALVDLRACGKSPPIMTLSGCSDNHEFWWLLLSPCHLDHASFSCIQFLFIRPTVFRLLHRWILESCGWSVPIMETPGHTLNHSRRWIQHLVSRPYSSDITLKYGFPLLALLLHFSPNRLLLLWGIPSVILAFIFYLLLPCIGQMGKGGVESSRRHRNNMVDEMRDFLSTSSGPSNPGQWPLDSSSHHS
jgi:hypothetical protein